MNLQDIRQYIEKSTDTDNLFMIREWCYDRIKSLKAAREEHGI